MRQQLPLVRILLSRSADTNACGSEGAYLPRCTSPHDGGPGDVVALLEKGADPPAGGPARDAGSAGVLSWVAFAGQTETLELLIDHGLDVTAKGCGAVLHIAAASGHTAIVERLLYLGASAEVLDGDGKTPL